MSFTGRFVPEHLGGNRLGPFAAFMLRIVLAGALTAAVIGIASFGLLFATAPAWASLIFEPLSLLLIPGLGIAMALSGPHDLEPSVVVTASIVVYFLLFFALLEARAWRRRNRAAASHTLPANPIAPRR